MAYSHFLWDCAVGIHYMRLLSLQKENCMLVAFVLTRACHQCILCVNVRDHGYDTTLAFW